MEDVMRNSKIQFIRSLGYLDPHADDHLYSALMLQPRVVGGTTLIGVLLQTPAVFFALSAALAWSAVFPALSVFDAIYNYGVARRRGLAPVAVAPAPRRFAGGLAAIITFATAIALVTGARTTGWALEALLVVAVTGVVVGRACAGADLYNFLNRQRSREVDRRAVAQR
jgi:hypothetical protein